MNSSTPDHVAMPFSEGKPIPSRWGQLWAVLRQRCPNCGKGRVFSGLTTMNRQCDVCGLLFQREAGYFLGAMYISYPIGMIFLLIGTLILHLMLPDWGYEWLVLLALIPYLPLVPLVFRYSRLLWIYFERNASQDDY
jgi:uncharacterized protein (DUF983 family)